MHLSPADIERYLRDGGDTAVDSHLVLCAACVERVAEHAVAAVRWERRGLLARLARPGA